MSKAKGNKMKKEKLSEFQLHQQTCKQCQKVDLSDSKTFINHCMPTMQIQSQVNSARLIKDHFAAIARKEVSAKNRALKAQFEIGIQPTTKKKLKEVMRYVGDLI